MRDYRRLLVWGKSHQFALTAYRISGGFPVSETYGLTSQLRRAATSIPSNIAEGCGRESDGELRRFLFIAMGSANEVEYQLLLAKDLGYLGEQEYHSTHSDLSEVKRMLSGLLNRVRGSV